jgi:hypothetical protein
MTRFAIALHLGLRALGEFIALALWFCLCAVACAYAIGWMFGVIV